MSATVETAMAPMEVFRILHNVRDDEIVVASMGAAREWQKFDPHPLDFIHVPSSMGQTQSLALGLALAQPRRRVIAACGDGSILMNAGSLVTTTALAPENLTVIVMDNQSYEVTGYQPTNASPSMRGNANRVELVSLARSCGFSEAHEFSDLATWNDRASDVIRTSGPVFVSLKVTGAADAGPPPFPGPGPERAKALRRRLTDVG